MNVCLSLLSVLPRRSPLAAHDFERFVSLLGAMPDV